MKRLQRVGLLVVSLFVVLPGQPGAQHPARATFPPAEVPARNDILVDNRVAIPMRDGVILYADVYRPVGEQRYPVLVSRTPYSTERFPSAYDAGVYFSRRGYVYVFQDVRGRHESDGRWEPFFDDEKDVVHTFGGWFDIFSQGTLRGYVGMSHKGATRARAARQSHRNRRVGTRLVAEDGRHRFRPDRARRRVGARAPLVRLQAQRDRQRPRRK